MDASAVFKGLDDSSASVRSTTLDKLIASAEENDGHVLISNLKRLFQLLKLRLVDENWGVVEQTEQYLYEIIPEFGPELESHMSMLLPNLVLNLGDSRALIRRAAVRVLARFLKFTQNTEALFGVLISQGIESEKRALRRHSCNAVAQILDSFLPGADYVLLLESLTSRLDDVDADVAQAATEALEHMRKVLDISWQRTLRDMSSHHQSAYSKHFGQHELQGASSSNSDAGARTGQHSQLDDLRFGIIPVAVINQIADESNWRERSQGIEEMYNVIESVDNPRALQPHLGELLQFLTGNPLSDANFKIAMTTMGIIEQLCVLMGHEMEAVLSEFVPHLIEKLGENKTIVRETSMRIFKALMQSLSPAPVLVYLVGALSHHNAHVREDVINTIIMAMLTFRGHDFDYEWLIESLDAVLMDEKPKVKLVGIEALAVIYEAVGDDIFDMTNFMSEDTMAVLETRFMLPDLPSINRKNGLVEHTFMNRTSTPQLIPSRSSENVFSPRSSAGSEVNNSAGRLPFQVSKPRATSARRTTTHTSSTSTRSSGDSDASAFGYGDMRKSTSSTSGNFQLEMPANRSEDSDNDLEPDIDGNDTDRQLGYNLDLVYQEDQPDSAFAGSVGFYHTNANVNSGMPSPGADSQGIFEWHLSPGTPYKDSHSSGEGAFPFPDGAKTPDMFEEEHEVDAGEPMSSSAASTKKHRGKANSKQQQKQQQQQQGDDDFDPFKPRRELSRGGRDGGGDETAGGGGGRRAPSRHKLRASHDEAQEFGYGEDTDVPLRSPQLSASLRKRHNNMARSGSKDLADAARSGLLSNVSADATRNTDNESSAPPQSKRTTGSKSARRAGGARQQQPSKEGGYAAMYGRRVQSADVTTDKKTKARQLSAREQRRASLREVNALKARMSVMDSDDEDSEDLDELLGGVTTKKASAHNNGSSSTRKQDMGDERPIQGVSGGGGYLAALNKYTEAEISPSKGSTGTSSSEEDGEGDGYGYSPSTKRLSSATRRRLASGEEAKRKGSGSLLSTMAIESEDSRDSPASVDSDGSGVSTGSRRTSKSRASSAASVGSTPGGRGRRQTLMETSAKPLGEMASEDLTELESPSREVKAALRDLEDDNSKWDTQYEALNTVRRAAVFHSQVLLGNDLHSLVLLLNAAVNNLRSQISKNAITCYGDMFAHIARSLDSELDYIVPVLVKKTGETNVFITDAVDRALELMVQNATDSKVLASLLTMCAHKNPQVRGNSAFYLDRLIERVGSRVVQIKGFERLLQVVANSVGEGNSVTRNIGRHMAYQVWEACGSSDSEFEKRAMRANISERMLNALKEAVATAKQNGGSQMPVSKLTAEQRRRYSTVGLSQRTMSAKRNGRRASRNGSEAGDVFGSGGSSSSSSSSSTTSGASSSGLASPVVRNATSRGGSGGRRPPRQRHGSSSSSNAFLSTKLPKAFDKVSTIVEKLDSKLWQDRLEGMEEMCALVDEYPSESVHVLPKLFDGFTPRLSDGNLKVLLAALECVPKLAESLGDHVETVLPTLVLGMTSSLSSSKKKVQTLAEAGMRALVEHVRASLLVQPFTSLVDNGNTRTRPVVLGILMDLVEPLWEEKGAHLIGKYVLKSSFALLNAKKIDIKKANNALIRKCADVMGGELDSYTRGLSQEHEELVMRLIV